MHNQLCGTALGQGSRAIQRPVRAVEAQAHLRGHRDMCWDRTTHFAHDGMEQLRLLEQHRATAGFVHRLGRTTEVQVNDRRAQGAGEGRIVRQAQRVRTQQLQTHWRTGAGLRSIGQLGGQLVKGGCRQQPVADTDKLGDAPVDAADTGQHIAQDFVDQPLHGSQSDLHDRSLENTGRVV